MAIRRLSQSISRLQLLYKRLHLRVRYLPGRPSCRFNVGVFGLQKCLGGGTDQSNIHIRKHQDPGFH